jgi:hypothetical protein
VARNTLKLDTKGLEPLIKKLDSIGGDVKGAVNTALTKAGQTIAQSTENAISAANLPAGGKYSKDTTKESIIRDAQVRWEGDTAWVPVGFDFSKPGAGGFLITGTPRMKPDYELNKIYKQKRYMNLIQKGMEEIILNSIVEKMEG